MTPINPDLERLTFTLILITVSQLCFKSGDRIKGCLMGMGGIIFAFSWLLHSAGIIQ